MKLGASGLARATGVVLTVSLALIACADGPTSQAGPSSAAMPAGSPAPTVRPPATDALLADAPATHAAGTDPPGASAAPRRTGRAPAGGHGPLRLVTLGDTYTSGGPVRPQDSWPAQLVRALEPGLTLTLADNLAAQGQTSENVIAEQLWALPGLRPHVVTIQVGANDIISPDLDLDDYRANVGIILDALLAEVPPDRVFAVSTPDFTLTARGGDFGDREAHRAEVHEANAIMADETAARGIDLIDISPVSDRVAEDPTLVAPDGLYPSAKQYAGWVELIAPRIRAALGGDG